MKQIQTLSGWLSDIISFAMRFQLIYEGNSRHCQPGFRTSFPLQYSTNWTIKQIQNLSVWLSDNVSLKMLHKLIYEANANTVSLAFRHCFHHNALPTDLWSKSEHCLLGSPTSFSLQCSTAWSMKQIQTLSAWLSDLISLAMLYQLNYEANPNIVSLVFGHHFSCNALLIDLWSKSEHCHLGFQT